MRVNLWYLVNFVHGRGGRSWFELKLEVIVGLIFVVSDGGTGGKGDF